MNLSASAQEIANVIGRERTLFLISQLPRCFSGAAGKKSTRVIMYVPKTIKPNHRLVEILGFHDAMKLVRAFGGEILQPANCNEIYARFRDVTIIRFLGEGRKTAEIAELMDVSERHVRNLARENPQEDLEPANENNRHGLKPAPRNKTNGRTKLNN